VLSYHILAPLPALSTAANDPTAGRGLRPASGAALGTGTRGRRRPRQRIGGSSRVAANNIRRRCGTLASGPGGSTARSATPEARRWASTAAATGAKECSLSCEDSDEGRGRGAARIDRRRSPDAGAAGVSTSMASRGDASLAGLRFNSRAC
jgi:hypothetical protein